VVLARAAEQRGIPPLGPEDFRVRRPTEVDPPATLPQREALLKEMFWMAWSDGELDESELRVVRAFARAWGVDPQHVQEWTEIATHGDDNVLERWVTRIGRYLFPGW
jgi:DnaJ-domain-containing protein 1